MKNKVLLCMAAAAVLFTSCSSAPKVARVDAGTQTDLSGLWNDGDVRIVCKDLIKQCIESPRVSQAIKQMNRNPLVVIGRFKNDSSEHIDTEIISKVMEVEIFNTGILDFVAGGDTRDELRAERADQDDWGARENSGSDLLGESGADFMLTGTVKTVIDKAGNQTVRTYFVSAEMTNISTNARMWMGQNTEIKKIIVQPKNRL
jgi:PBP1b-binding outer membrane lipoprotein LpoB